MDQLSKGQFYGQTNKTIHLAGITLTDTAYTHDHVDWHYHENPYFTLLLEGRLIEGNKKEIYTCSAGTLLFHNWQEPHYNTKPPGYARGIHIELEPNWASKFGFSLTELQGNINITNPHHKLLFYAIFKESKINDPSTEIAIQGLLLQALTGMRKQKAATVNRNPGWVKKVADILHDNFLETITLTQLANAAAIHPVHLSRDFQKYFHCGFGDYIRTLKIEKSLSLLPDKNRSLSALAFDCGFADQSHFTRCFKAKVGINPMAYRKMLHN